MDAKFEDLEHTLDKTPLWSIPEEAYDKYAPKGSAAGGRWSPPGAFQHRFLYWGVIGFLLCLHLYTVVQHHLEKEVQWRAPPQPLSVHGLPPSSVCGGDLEDHSRIHMSPLCGTWQEDYKRKHGLWREQLAQFVQRGWLDPKTGLPAPAWRIAQPDALPKILIFVCSSQEDGIPCGGLGDSLKGFTTSLLYSVIADRAVFMHWPLVHSAFEPVEIDWTLPDGYVLPGNSSETWGNVEKRGEDVVILNLINRERLPFQEMHELIGDTRIAILRFNKGRVISWLHDHPAIHDHLGLTAPYAWGCLNRFLMRVKPEVSRPFEAIARQLEDPETFSVCVHIRLNDEAMGGQQRGDLERQLQMYLECVQSLMSYWMTPACKRSRIFLISSSYELKQLALANSTQVLTTAIKPAHIDRPGAAAAAMASTVAEWDLYSRCNMYVFETSGLSVTASAYGLRPLSSYVMPRDFMGNREVMEKVCVPWHPTARSDVADSWGGAVRGRAGYPLQSSGFKA